MLHRRVKQLKLPLKNLCKMSVFTQKLNPILGESTWEWQHEEYDYHQEIARSSFADMLHDRERNEMYYAALKKAVAKVHAAGKRAKVLDIGTGTGLLSMMTVHCGADSVVACEAFAPMSRCAAEVTSLNGCGDKIKIVPKHSTDLTVGEDGDLPERANILVAEVFDTELIGEGALSTFSHAHKKLLEADCIVVPNSATVYVQVVETALAEIWNRFNDIYDADGQILLHAPDRIRNCQGSVAIHDIQLSQLETEHFKEIVSPIPVMRFDWSGKTAIECSRSNRVAVKAKRDGKAQVVFMWWELQMDMDNEITLSCAPYWAHPLRTLHPNLTSAQIPWRDHWMQGLYYLPEELSVQKDEEFTLLNCHDEFSWWFHVTKEPLESYPKPICDCSFHIAHSRARIGQLNDESRNKKYVSVLKKYVNSESIVLLIGDGLYLGLIAAKLNASKVLYLSDNYLSTKVFKDFIKCNNFTNVEVIENVEALVNHKDIKRVNLVFGHPHFSTTILPWDSLYFAYLVNKIQGHLAQNARIIPRSASLNAVVVRFKDLQKIRLPLESCGEFEMKPFDDLIEESSSSCDANVEPQPLWEYPCIAKSPVVELAKLDLVKIFASSNIEAEKCLHKCMECECCNGVALWVDWYLDDCDENIISTGPVAEPVLGQLIKWDMHIRQGVHLMKSNIKNQVHCKFHFDVKNGNVQFLFS